MIQALENGTLAPTAPPRIVRPDFAAILDGFDRTTRANINPRLVDPQPLTARLINPEDLRSRPGLGARVAHGFMQCAAGILVSALGIGLGTLAAAYFFQGQ